MNLEKIIQQNLVKAIIDAGFAEDSSAIDPKLTPSTRANFGHYQANCAMSLAKKLKQNPREIAQKIVATLDHSIYAKVEIAGAGFINLTLSSEFLTSQLKAIINNGKLIENNTPAQTIVIDYSAPNVAKQMHVGHLRSTIIGDANARILEYLGNNVIRANHIGDWGTQFGMLIAYLELKDKAISQANNGSEDNELADLEDFYRQAKKLYDEDPIFSEKARSYVVKLQSGDQDCYKMWQRLVDITMTQNQNSYDRLNVSLKPSDIMGESLYNPMLAGIVADLKAKNIATMSEGAVVVFLPEFNNKNGEPMAVIIQKSDGGYLYATTDIACIKYRMDNFNCDRILYFTDSRQAQHLKQVWLIAQKAGYISPEKQLEHCYFGMMLGADNKPFKTRSGDTVKLNDLLDEAFERAHALILQKNPQISAEDATKIAKVVSIGAVKYADLSKNRTTDYVFNWDNMLSFEGNTAPYLQYAISRINSIFAQVEAFTPTDDLALSEEYEISLGLKLLQFEQVVRLVADNNMPHFLCNYLYELAGLFSSFYENCPVLKAEPQLRQSRLNLLDLSLKTLKQGLDLLGIESLQRM